MRLFTRISRRLRRRRVEADPVWRAATRAEAAGQRAASSGSWPRPGRCRRLVVSPEEQRRDAVQAARERPEERQVRLPDGQDTPDGLFRRVWVDAGSGPGYEVLVPRDD